MGNRELQDEFRRTNGNREPLEYEQERGPTYCYNYVEWLEKLVIQSRTRPDLARCDEGYGMSEI